MDTENKNKAIEYTRRYCKDENYVRISNICKTNIREHNETDYSINSSFFEKMLKRFVISNFKSIYLANKSFTTKKKALMNLLIDFPFFYTDLLYGCDIEEFQDDNTVKLVLTNNEINDSEFLLNDILECVFETDFCKSYFLKLGITKEQVIDLIRNECYIYACKSKYIHNI